MFLPEEVNVVEKMRPQSAKMDFGDLVLTVLSNTASAAIYSAAVWTCVPTLMMIFDTAIVKTWFRVA
jgi:hypothetical protein